ncbi:MAG: short-chain dehydrogenase/reductase [Actinomycetia bacterium]|nr:short-chain dehydrogenase/reductase [Actinomycetes bacterium]
MAPLDPLATFRLDGKTALVTGASSGLGARFARVLDAAGAKVVLVARRADRLESVASELHGARTFSVDLSDIDAAESLVAEIGPVDVLVNNAGITDVAPALDESTASFRRVVELNLIAPFVLAREAARSMTDRGVAGSIVNIASIVGVVGVGQIPQAGYAASKGGLVNLTRELGAQWARKNVRVNALAPGWFRSELTEGKMFGDEAGERWIRSRTPMGRGGEASELDGALLFLASDASTFVTGQVLCVDGGWTIV